jgi:transposase
MMGTKARVFAPLSPVSLEDLDPPDHFYRHLERSLDLSFVRDLVRDRYAPGGRPSVDPVVFFKLQLVLFFEGLRSERQLMQVVADRLSLRWYLGYDLTEPLPDHSSLTRIRERYGLEIFRTFFERIVEQCIAAGLVWGRELYVDATKVEANASLDSVAPRFAVELHLDALFTAANAPEDVNEKGIGDGPAQFPVALTSEAHVPLTEVATRRHDWIGNAGRPDRRVVRGDYQRLADFRASSTDPDASLMRYRGGGLDLGYHDHYVVDGGKARIVLAAQVSPAEVMENLPMRDLLWRVCFRWKLRPRQVTGDTTYGTTENIVAVEDAGIRAYFPLPASATGRASSAGSTSPTMPTATSTTVPAARSCASASTNTLSARGSTKLRRLPATRASSSRNAPTAPRGGKSSAASTSPISSGFAPTTSPRSSPRPCANARSGSNRYLRRERPGMGSAASACEDCRGSTWRRC